MLTPKLGPQALLPQAWLPRSSAPAPSRPIAQARVSLLESHKSYSKRLLHTRRSFDWSNQANTRIVKNRRPRTVMAATAVALVGSAGVAGYATSADTREETSTVSHTPTFTPHFESAAFQIPHPEKQHKGGEDTFLVSSNGLVLGVFDGVGGWADSGVDPRDYALKLSQGAQEATDVKGLSSPLEVMRYAARFANRVTGSSTACIVGVDGNNLISANLGDSGFMIVRLTPDAKRVDLIFKSEEQQHSFNFPYQLGPQSRDKPDDADLLSVPIQHGDIIILGTDGLFDNIDATRICKVIDTVLGLAGDGPSSKLNISSLARYIAADAFRTSQDPNAVTPFAIGSRHRYRGGKPDDITVLVSRVNLQAPVSDSSNATKAKNTTTSASTTSTSNSTSTSQTHRVSSAEEETTKSAASPSFLARLWGLRPWGAAYARL